MNVMTLMATIGLESKGYESGLKRAEGMARSTASAIGKALGGIAIGAVGGITAVGAAVFALTKQSVKAYAEYEQLVGGVETLFGTGGKSFDEYKKSASESLYKMGQTGEDIMELQRRLNKEGAGLVVDGVFGPKTQAALQKNGKVMDAMMREQYDQLEATENKMIDNAWNAYQKVGVDANTYMETVTSFSASLVKSLGGDTNKAVELADQAMVDMADNSNKMGTPIENIMNAYQGFAKQNYTMLDNLKLGYGGTKSEMERLIKDANKLRKEQGLTGDLTIEKYSDIIEAIHLVQENMGIAGTTEKEAQETIQGSLNATKASWKNLLTAFGTGDKKRIDQAFQGLVKYGKAFVKNVAPAVKNSLKGMSTVIKEIGPVIVKELPGLISDVVPDFLSAVGTLAGSIVDNFPAMVGALGGAIKQAIVGDKNASWPEVGQAIINGIQDKFGELKNGIKGLLGIEEGASWPEIGTAIGNGANTAVTKGVNFVKTLLGIEEGASWTEIGTAISNGANTAITAGVNFIKALLGVDGTSWTEIGTSIGQGANSIITAGVSFIKGLLGVDGTPWTEVGNSIITGVQNAFKDLPKAGAGFIMGLLFGKNEEEGETETEGDTIAQQIAERVGEASDVEKKTKSLESAVETVIKYANGDFGNGSEEKGSVKNSIAHKIAQNMGSAAEVDSKASLMETAITKVLTVMETVAAGIAAIKMGEKIAAVMKSAYETLTVWGGKLTSFVTSHPILAALIAGAQLSWELDQWAINRDYGDYNQAHDEYAGLMTKPTNDLTPENAQKVDELRPILQQLEENTNPDNGKELTQEIADFQQQLKNTEGLWELIEKKLPEDKTVKQLQGAFEEGLTWDQLFENGYNGQGIDWEMLATNAFTEVADLIANLLNGGDEGDTSKPHGKVKPGYSVDENGDLVREDLGNVKAQIKEVTEATKTAVEALGSASNDLETDVTTALTTAGDTAGPKLKESLGGAAASAAEEAGAKFDEVVGKERTMNVKVNLFGGGGVSGGGIPISLADLLGDRRFHATAMSRGEILRGLTPFGMDANGTMHYGGEAGAEAVVGVNSLDHMIQESVRNAIGAVLGKMDQLIGGQDQGDVKIVLNNGALVGQMVKEMDRQLGSTARRRGGGRT